MIEILEPEEQYIPKIGEVLWGAAADWSDPKRHGNDDDPCQERVSGLKFNVLDGSEFQNQILCLLYLDPNPIKAAKKMDVDISFFCKHKDPYTDCEVYGIVPVAVLSDNIHKYKGLFWEGDANPLPLDVDFVKESYGKRTFEMRYRGSRDFEINEIFKLTPIQTLVMGSGYSYGCSFNDGNHSCLPAKVKMSNGDWLFVWFWEWYNK